MGSPDGGEPARHLSVLSRRGARDETAAVREDRQHQLGDYHVTVNAIAPGLTLSMDELDPARDAQNRQRLQARAIKRTEVPQDVVGAAVFFCSAESDFITGQTLVVDGGAQMH